MKGLFLLFSRIIPVILLLVMISCNSLSTFFKSGNTSMVPAGFIEIPDEVIDNLGIWAFEIWCTTVKINHDAKDKELVEEVMEKIIRISPAADQFEWEIVLIEDSEPDAICFPGGKIGINTGLLGFTDRSEEWLAVVIGHEVAHVLARDARDRINDELKGALITAVTGDKLRNEGLDPETTAAVMTAMGVSWQLGVVLPFSREAESRADKASLLLMAKAGYNPATILSFWEEMKARSAMSELPEFFSTHPSDRTRIEKIRDFLPIARNYISSTKG